MNTHSSSIHSSQKVQQPKCPSNNASVSKMNTVKYYAAIKINEAVKIN
jgi:hypothetical protein